MNPTLSTGGTEDHTICRGRHVLKLGLLATEEKSNGCFNRSDVMLICKPALTLLSTFCKEMKTQKDQDLLRFLFPGIHVGT